MNKTAVMAVVVFSSIVIAMTTSAWSGGPPDEKTGAPGEGTCRDCHNTYQLNNPNGSLVITGIPTQYLPGNTYVITVSIEFPGQQRWGFEVTVLDVTSNKAGNLTATDAVNTQLSFSGGRSYIKHTSTGTHDGTLNGPINWSFEWIAPSEGTGAVTFYGAGNAADSSGNTNGDFIYTTSVFSNEFIPTIDYIILTDSPDGLEIPDNITRDLGNPLTIYASAYNNTVNGSIGLVSVQWLATPLTGGVGTFDNNTGTSTTFTGTDAGWVEIKGVNNTLGMNDTIDIELIGTSLEIDDIILTDGPDGNELTTVVLGVSGTVEAFASGYNSTGPTYIDLVDADWSGPGGAWSPDTGASSSTFTAGSTGGSYTQTAQSVLPPGLSDTFSVFIDLDPPSVTHTPVTSGTSGPPIQISADITDNNVLDEVFLYYKKPTDSTYTALQMSVSGDTYSADIPANEVTSEGLEYYISASDNAAPPNIIYFGDSGQTGSEPTAANDIDISIVDVDTTPPSITHTLVTAGTIGIPINITADIMDADAGVQNAWLYYKKPGDSSYAQVLMEVIGNTYYAEIPGTAVTSDGLEYYIKAQDSASTPNVAYYSAAGQTATEPTSGNDIDIVISAGDLVSPTVTSHSPTGTNVPLDTTITVTFNFFIDAASTESAFSIAPSVVGVFQWSGNTLTFTPSADLDYNTVYNVTIGTGATDLAGNALALYSWEFTTIPGATAGPEVDEYAPETTNVPVEGTVIEIWFTEDMDKDNTEDAISIIPAMEYIESWPRDDQIRLSPVDPLKYNTIYTVTVSTNATNKNGQPLLDEESWSFHTEKAPKEEFDWETWEPIVTGLTILISLIAFLIGFLTLRKKRGKLRQYMEKVDNTFNEYKKNYQECEKELITLREYIKKDVKDGKIEEDHFLILDKKIDDYLREMKALEKSGAAGGAVTPEAESVGELKDA
jgi:hypothetical protein